MVQVPFEFVPPDQARQLIELAERSRLGLSRFAKAEVEYNAIGLQMLDEWIDRHLRQFPKPSREIFMAWGTFLGETLRRRFGGEWGVSRTGGRPRLGIICLRNEREMIFVDVMEQLQRRIKTGMHESLAFYYTMKGIELHSDE